jgi:hypothetical protein
MPHSSQATAPHVELGIKSAMKLVANYSQAWAVGYEAAESR